MTNALSKAGKRLFAHDPEVRPYAAADTAYDDDEYAPEHTEDERADADRRKVSNLILIFFFFPLQHTLLRGTSPPFPPIHSSPPLMLISYLLHIRSVTFPLAFQKEMLPFYAR